MSEAGQLQDNGQPSSVGKQEPMVEMPEVKPDDSASQCGSESSSTSSVRLRVMARKAALAAEAAALEEQHELELEELRLAQRKSRLSMKTKLQVAEAEERIYLAYENRKLGISSPGMKLGDQKVADDETLPYPDKKVVSTSSPEAASPKEESGHVPMSESAEFRLPKQGQQARMTADYERAEPSPDSVESGRILSSGNDAELVNLMKQGQLQQQRILETVQLPKAELTPYDGNPLGFWEFWRCFEDSVDSALVEDKTKLTRLLHYCSGEPKKLLGPCLLMSSSVGYATAKRLLFERFGDPVQITEAWMKRMTKGKSIGPRDKKALRELADDMNVCLMSFQAMGFEYELSPQRILLPLVERLPLYLKGKWLNRVGAIRRQQRIPGFEDLLSFVQEAAQEMNDPVYGDLMSSQSDLQRSSRSGRSKGSFSTSAGERPTETECVQCKGNHKLWDCKRFKEMSPKDRIRFARKKGLCFSCLKAGHMTAGCTKKKTCSVGGCVRQHNKLLHISEQTAEQKTDSGTQDSGTQNTYVESEASCSSTGAGKRGVLPIVPVRVKAEGRQVAVWTYALLDTGSTSSFCSTKLARRLGAKGVKEKLLLTTLECRESAVHTEVISLVVDSGNNSKKIMMSHVYTRDDINVKGIHMAAVDDIKDLNHLKGIDVPVATEDDVGLIIGQDVPEALLPLEVRRGERGPYAVRTCLGWSLHGPLSRSDQRSTTVHATNTFIAEDLCLERQLEKFWKLETPDPFKEERGMSRNDIKALAEWEQGVCIDKGHYQLPIPFKKRPPDLENNRWLAEKRLQSLGRRLYQTEGLLLKYSDGMVELLRKGYAEEVTNHDSENGCKWYLPHHPVLHPMKPGKVRIVFDCASAWKGLSLNDVVYQGPDLTNKLIGVLLRFRCAPVALMADIESMFHQVRVPAADRDVLRFLWWPSGDMKEDPHVYRMCVHLFGGTWSPSVCSYALRKTAEDYESDYSPEVSRIVKHQFYVDDCLVAVADEGAAIRIAEELMSLLKRGGFRLTKWVSNRPNVLKSIPEEERAKQVKGLDLNKEALPVERALGINWDVQEDLLEYKTVIKERPLTRRGLLSIVSSIYDPLGYLSPFIVRAKLLMQRLATRKLGWDDPIPDAERQTWQQWVKQLPEMENFKVPRCVVSPEYCAMTEYQLHHFADASEDAYGAVTYLVARNTDGQVCSNLVFAKSHLAPMKKTTIPRLELMAATVAVKSDVLLRKELSLQLKESVFWTDSMIVLAYIRNEDKRFHTFIANRLSMIHSATEVKQWHHVSTKENPADDVSRGMNARDLVACRRWLHGPGFILLTEEQRSRDPESDDAMLDDDPEVKTAMAHAASAIDVQVPSAATDQLLNHFSNWFKLKKAVARILQFKKYLLCKVQKKTFDCEVHLAVGDLREAEQAILRYVQCQVYPVEYQAVNEKPVSDGKQRSTRLKKSSPLYKLDPMMSRTGLLCVGGRLRNAELSDDMKHPIILPPKHHVVTLLVRHVHDLVGHSGREHVLSKLRQRYWLIRGRYVVRQVQNDCFKCRRLSSPPLRQKMADLPGDRVAFDKPPFTNVGVDCFGPYLVKQGRNQLKRYGCIFTCLCTRAVHIEILHSLDTDSFLNGLQRFIARRGKPELIRSDNGTNFVGAERELREGLSRWNQQRIHDHLLQKGIVWKFNPPSASHMGGSWERQIRTTRKVLGALMRQQVLSDENLSTLMCSVESIINGRPLTVVSDDVRDPEPLTPNHLLLLRGNGSGPPDVFEARDVYSKRRWRQVQYLSDIFWQRWKKEYIPMLQARQRWNEREQDVSVGDIVHIVEDTPRNQWTIGRVVETFPSEDGLVRSVRVQTKSSTLVRPIHKLCLLESVNYAKP